MREEKKEGMDRSEKSWHRSLERFLLTGTKAYRSPVRILAIMALAIFAAETLVMIILLFIPNVSGPGKTLIDASMLIILLSPFLYYYLFRPLVLLIDERRRAENDLKMERAMAQGYLDVAGVMMVALDRDGRVKLINRKGAEILGYAEEEIKDKDWFDNFIPPGNRAGARSRFLRLMSGEVKPEGC